MEESELLQKQKPAIDLPTAKLRVRIQAGCSLEKALRSYGDFRSWYIVSGKNALCQQYYKLRCKLSLKCFKCSRKDPSRPDNRCARHKHKRLTIALLQHLTSIVAFLQNHKIYFKQSILDMTVELCIHPKFPDLYPADRLTAGSLQ